MYFLRPVVFPFHNVGVDGGGTKTELILVDPAGTGVATHIPTIHFTEGNRGNEVDLFVPFVTFCKTAL